MKGEKSIRKKCKKISLDKIIAFCFITTIILTNLTLSKYKNTIANESNVVVAIMANSIYVDINENISGYPGCDPIICPITLTNKNENGVCEVTQKFEISIDRANIQNLPIVFSMYKDELCTEIIEPNENGVYTNDEFILNAGIEQAKTIYLKISWPENVKDSSLAFEIDYFRLHIVSSQID